MIHPGPFATTLHEAISAFFSAQKAYNNCTPGDDEDRLFDTMGKAESAVLDWPCHTIEDVRAKARFVLEDDGVQDTLLNSISGQESCLLPFLRSLCSDTGRDDLPDSGGGVR